MVARVAYTTTYTTTSASATGRLGDFIASVFHAIQLAHQEGRQIELPEELTEDEATRLSILISEMMQPPPMPRYAVDAMPPGLSEEESLNLALQ
jgi:hypothetical protein